MRASYTCLQQPTHAAEQADSDYQITTACSRLQSYLGHALRYATCLGAEISTGIAAELKWNCHQSKETLRLFRNEKPTQIVSLTILSGSCSTNSTRIRVATSELFSWIEASNGGWPDNSEKEVLSPKIAQRHEGVAVHIESQHTLEILYSSRSCTQQCGLIRKHLIKEMTLYVFIVSNRSAPAHRKIVRSLLKK